MKIIKITSAKDHIKREAGLSSIDWSQVEYVLDIVKSQATRQNQGFVELYRKDIENMPPEEARESLNDALDGILELSEKRNLMVQNIVAELRAKI